MSSPCVNFCRKNAIVDLRINRKRIFSALFSTRDFVHINVRVILGVVTLCHVLKVTLFLLYLWILENILFSTLLEYILWHLQLKFVMLKMYFVLMIVRSSLIAVISSKFLWYTRLPKGRIMFYIVISCSPSAHPSDSASDSFPHFSRTCFDILHWNFMYDFVF